MFSMLGPLGFVLRACKQHMLLTVYNEGRYAFWGGFEFSDCQVYR